MRLARYPGFGWACGRCGQEFHAHDKGARHVAVCNGEVPASSSSGAEQQHDGGVEERSNGDGDQHGDGEHPQASDVVSLLSEVRKY